MKPFALALAAAAALLCAVPAQAQDLIATQLDSAAVLMRNQGYQPMSDAVRGDLPAGEDEEFAVELRSGTRYVVVGVCDGSCSDLDLVLVNAAGGESAADRELDDVPVVTFQADADGRFVVKVEMATCGSAQCEYGVRVFRAANP
jgi:hypothetical protein